MTSLPLTFWVLEYQAVKDRVMGALKREPATKLRLSRA